MKERTTAALVGKEEVMADETRKGKPGTGTTPWAPTTPQEKALSASMMDTDKTRGEVEKAAYYRWLNRGRPTGDDWTDWLQAERELKKRGK
jgi:hypothetical protein